MSLSSNKKLRGAAKGPGSKKLGEKGGNGWNYLKKRVFHNLACDHTDNQPQKKSELSLE